MGILSILSEPIVIHLDKVNIYNYVKEQYIKTKGRICCNFNTKYHVIAGELKDIFFEPNDELTRKNYDVDNIFYKIKIERWIKLYEDELLSLSLFPELNEDRNNENLIFTSELFDFLFEVSNNKDIVPKLKITEINREVKDIVQKIKIEEVIYKLTKLDDEIHLFFKKK
jgi:hypothetical protein